MTANFYQPLEIGVQLVATGNTAYNTEYNGLYPLLKDLKDDQLCKLQYIDTIPEVSTVIWFNASLSELQGDNKLYEKCNN